MALRCSASRRSASISCRSSSRSRRSCSASRALVGYVVHERRHAHALLDLELFRLATYRAGVVGGSLFRIGIGATPFLLPLMLQLGFGLSPVESGLAHVRVGDGRDLHEDDRCAHVEGASASAACCCGTRLLASACSVRVRLVPADDAAVRRSSATLFVSGCCRSLQFTSLNAISYADVDSPRMGQASSLSGMLQQLSLSLGVAIGGYSLEIFGALADRPATDVHNFYWAFVVVGLISASSAYWAWRLPRHAGAEMAGRTRTARNEADPSTAELPAG